MFQQTFFYGGNHKIILISRENPKYEKLSKTLGQLLSHEDYASIDNFRKKKTHAMFRGAFRIFRCASRLYLFIYAATCRDELPIPDGKHRLKHQLR